MGNCSADFCSACTCIHIVLRLCAYARERCLRLRCQLLLLLHNGVFEGL